MQDRSQMAGVGLILCELKPLNVGDCIKWDSVALLDLCCRVRIDARLENTSDLVIEGNDRLLPNFE